MWSYGRAFPRKISAEDAEQMRLKHVQESRRKGAETLKCRRLEAFQGRKNKFYSRMVYNIKHDIVYDIIYNIVYYIV